MLKDAPQARQTRWSAKTDFFTATTGSILAAAAATAVPAVARDL
jgi:hypothetical protein